MLPLTHPPFPSLPFPHTQRHHFAQTVSILNSEGCNIFENLSHENYRLMLDLIRHNILSTDLAHHIRIMSNIKDIAKGEVMFPLVQFHLVSASIVNRVPIHL